MKCDEAQARLIEHLYGELPLDEKAALRGHLAECDSCRHAMEALEQGRQQLERLTEPEVRLAPGHVYRAEAARSERGRRRWRRVAIVASAAAVLVAALAGARLRLQWGPDQLIVSWGQGPAAPEAVEPETTARSDPSPPRWSEYEDRIEALEEVASLLAAELRASDVRQAAATADFERRLARWQRGMEEAARQSNLRWRLAQQDIQALYLTQFSPDLSAKGAIP